MSEILNELIKDLILIDIDGKATNVKDEVIVNEDLIIIKTKFTKDIDYLMCQLLIRIIGLKSLKLSSISINKKFCSLYFETI